MEKNNKLKDKIQGSQNSIYKAIQLVYFRFLDLFCHENIKILL